MSNRELFWGGRETTFLFVAGRSWEADVSSELFKGKLVVSKLFAGLWRAAFVPAEVIRSHYTAGAGDGYSAVAEDDQKALDELRGEMRVELEALKDAMGGR